MEKENKTEDKSEKKIGKKKMSKQARILLWVLVGGLVLGIIVIGVQMAQLPLAPTMNVVTATPDLSVPTLANTNTPIYVVVTNTPSGETATSTSTPLPTSTPESLTFCNESGNMNILLIGINEDSGIWPPGAEMIRVVNVDFTNQSIKMVAFPRDLYVPTSGLAAMNMPQQTLGLVYYYAKQAVRGDAKSLASYGASMLARTLLEDFNVTVDHYVVIDADIVPTLIDQVGGIEITLSEPVTGYDGIVFPAGRQWLNGALALNFVSVKSEDTEGPRIDRQQMVMEAFLEKAISLDMIPKIPQILNTLGNNVITDLSVSQISNMGCLVKKMDRSRIESYSILSPNLVYYSTDGLLLPNTQAITDYADGYLH
jgi:LCP family protein required for cell wall assembly